MPKRKKIFYGWWMAITAAILNTITGGTFIYGFTTFFNPIRSTFGWSAAITSIAFTLRGLETGLLDPLVGYMVDRFGPRGLILGGWFVAGLGFILMSRINSLWTFYAAFVVIAAGFSFGTFVVFNAAIANWFFKKRSRAITLIYVGFGLSGIIVPLVAWSINHFGWRDTAIYIGILLWLVGIPLSFVMRHKPEQYGYLPDGEVYDELEEQSGPSNIKSSTDIKLVSPNSPAEEFTAKKALKSRSFWLLSLAYFFQFIASSAVTVHIVPYLESESVPTAIAAIAVTGMTIGSLIGRVGFGFLGDYHQKRYLISIAFALQAFGVFIFSFIDEGKVWLLIPFLITYGAGFGGPIVLRAGIVADYFSTNNFGTIFGWVALIGMLGGMASPVVAGWIFDATGGYQLAWIIFALTTIPAIPLMLLSKPLGAKPEP